MDQYERLHYLKEKTNLSNEDIDVIRNPIALWNYDDANRMIENAIGMIMLPLGIATNFIINGKEYIIPMAIEEPSVIAGCKQSSQNCESKWRFYSRGRRILNDRSSATGLLTYFEASRKEKILVSKNELLQIANSRSRSITARDLEVRELHDKSQNSMGEMLLIELTIDTQDAMGANIINTMCESVAPRLEDITGGKVVLKILSNYATRRLVRCKATFQKNQLGGEQIVERILYAYALAYSDVYRAVTHNKGIMNGIDAVALATGQDFRAIEAGAHAFASKDGTYRSLTKWRKTKEGDLEGEIELPMAVGIVGG